MANPCGSVWSGFFRWLLRLIVEICTGATTQTSTNPGCWSRLTVMKIGASVSPCLFVQPGGSVRAARRKIDIQVVFFMLSPFTAGGSGE